MFLSSRRSSSQKHRFYLNTCSSQHAMRIKFHGVTEKTLYGRYIRCLITVTANVYVTRKDHVSNIMFKASTHAYLWYRLKRARMTQDGLLRIHLSVPRRGEYASQVGILICQSTYWLIALNVFKIVLWNVSRQFTKLITLYNKNSHHSKNGVIPYASSTFQKLFTDGRKLNHFLSSWWWFNSLPLRALQLSPCFPAIWRYTCVCFK